MSSLVQLPESNIWVPNQTIHSPDSIIWSPTVKQSFALERPETEILYGGARGGGKTDAGIAWILKWKDIPTARCLVIRLQAQDLREWLDRAERMFSQFGAVRKGKPAEFHFPSGFKVWSGHLGDPTAYQAYQGNEIQFLLIEELNQIPQEDWYESLFMSTRSTIPGVDKQVFNTANPGGPGHCVRYGEVLTPSGWVDIKDISIGDAVYTVNNGVLVESTVDQKHVEDFDGELVSVNARGLSMEFTPGHRVAIGSPDNFLLRTFDEWPGQATVVRSSIWIGEEIESFDVSGFGPARRRAGNGNVPKVVSGDNYMRLLGWFLSEGCVVERDKAFDIAQCKPHHRDSIAQLLDDCGMVASISGTQLRVHSHEWYGYFIQFGKCRDKYIPTNAKNAPVGQLNLLIESMMDGDGHWEVRGKGGTYYTISSRLADDFAEIAFKAGYVVYQSSRQRHGRDGLSYEVSIKKTKSGGTELLTGNHLYNVETETKRKSDISRVAYSGKVYCIGVPETHNFVIRQSGSVWVSGNSWVKSRFIDCLDYAGRPAVPGRPTLLDGKGERSRIFIQSLVDDNPHIIENDPGYVKDLESIKDPAKRAAWRYGDWNAFSGGYFPEFRKARVEGEPPEALHVIPRRPLDPHLKRWISWDWAFGHDSAVYWFCRDSDTRLHVYREMIDRQVAADTFGAKVAEASLEDLAGLNGGNMSLYLSWDAFNKRDSRNTIAEQIRDGVASVVGKDAVFLETFNEAEMNMTPEERVVSLAKRREAQKGKYGISIEVAQRDRRNGWAYLHTLMNWRRFRERKPPELDHEIIAALLKQEDGPIKYRDYINEVFSKDVEVLPRLLIHDNVIGLPDAILAAIHDPKDTDLVKKVANKYDDMLDSLRYGAMANKDLDEKLPFEMEVSKRMATETAKYTAISEQGLYMMRLVAEQAAKKNASKGGWFRVGRSGKK